MKALAIPMNQIEPYSLKHLEIVLIIVVLALAFAYLFAKTRVNRAGVLTVFGVFLLISEIVKQCLLTYVLGYYSWSDFPWQLCSIPMYICLAYPGLKKRRDTADAFVMCFGFIGAVAAFVLPKSSFYPYLILTIQSLAWHGILLMLSLFLMMGSSKSRSVRSFRGVAIWYLIAAAIALAIDFLTMKISDGDSNLFFIGPNDPKVKILRTIYYGNGWIVSSIVMVLASLAAAFVVYFVSGVGKRK